MPILYVNFDEQYNCTKKSPYSDFSKKFNSFKDELDEKEIEIRLGNGKNNGIFADGFYTDEFYCNNPHLNFKFASIDNDAKKEKHTFIQMTYSYDYGDSSELEYHLKKIRALKLRIPYLYIPQISYLDFNFQVNDDKLNWNFDVLLPNKEKTLEVCYSLISLIVSMFAFEE